MKKSTFTNFKTMKNNSLESNFQIMSLTKNIKLLSLFIFFTFFNKEIIAQTTIINPATAGGFESGATFALNGWTNTSGTVTRNQWVVNNGATAGFSGARCAYVSNDRGATPPPFTYSLGAARETHFYRNIAIPATETNIQLSFSWIGQGESSFDKMRVWIVPTTFTPTYGTAITATGVAPTGRVQVGATDYSSQGTWTTTSFNLPAIYAGTTVRLVFEWTNDGSFGTQPPAAIDNISLTSQIPVPPVNNECLTATGLTVNGTATCTTSTSGNTNFATPSQVGCSGTADDDVWYSFVATSTYHTITVTPTTLSDAVFQVFSGACGSLTSLDCINATTGSSIETTTLTGLTIGQTYRVRVYSNANGTGQGTFSICVTTPPPPPANDNCSGAVSLTVNPGIFCTTTTAGTILNATDSGVASTCFGTDDDDVWYRFTATNTTHFVNLLNVAGSTTDMYHAVYSGASGCGALGTPLICSDADSSTVTGLTIGQTYYVQVFTWTSTIGQTSTFDICISTPPPAPSNDNCAGAITLTVNPGAICTTTTAGTIASATDSGVTSSCFGTDDDDVWYRFTATNTTHYVSLLNVAGSATDMYHAVYSGASGCGSLGAALICSDADSSTVTGLTIGQTYYVQVYSYTSTTGQTSTFDICIGTPPPPPSNDNCGGAIVLTVNPDLSCGTTTAGSVASATDSGVTSSCFGTDDDDVWYRFTATNTTHYVSLLNVTGSTTDTYHAVYSGASGCGALGAALVCSDDDNSTVSGLTIGQTYYVQVYSYTSTTGQTSSFNICIGTPCNGSGPGTGTTTLGCPTVVSGGLGLNGADPAAIGCTAASTCVDLEATYLDLGNTTTYTVQSIPYAPPYQFNCLANPVSVNDDDVWSPAVNLPFNFCFYGNSYNQCTIGSNGILSFDMTNAGTSSGYLFSNNLPNTTGALFENTIYGVYHDIDPRAGGEVGWELITLNTGCRALVASWHDVPMFSNNSLLYTGMMVLYENTNVIEVYIENKVIDGTWNDGNAIVGVQNATGTAAVVAPGRNGLDANWTATNEAWRFVPSGASITSLRWYQGSGTTGPMIGTTDVINVCPTSTTTYTAEITYTLCNGSTLIETEETTVTVNGSKVWDGSVNTNWNVANNWTPVGVPTASDCVVIPDTANDPIISGTNFNALGLNLTVNNNATLTVTPDNYLTITDWVNINATGDLVLQNSASLIQINNNVNQGTMHMTRTANIRKLDYVYWSSPVTNFNLNNVSTGTTGSKYKWTPTIPTNTNGFGNWVGANEIMALGKGYIVRGPDSFTTTLAPFNTVFTGTPNNGIITTPISRGTWNGGSYATGVSTTLGTNHDDNWNLIGNPYPSAVDAIDFLTLNTNIDGFINVWTHGTLPSTAIADPFYNNYVYNYTPGDYITYNSSGASAGPGTFGGYIGAGQGFFVLMNHTSASTSENVTFNNSMRSSTHDNTQFFRTSDDNGRIWLDLISSNGSNVRSLVAYVDGATNNRDRMFDAITDEKINLNLYSAIGDEIMKIQGRTLPFDQEDRVPMGIKVPQNGNYTIGIAAVDGFFANTSQNIYLEDTATNIIHDLRQNPYTFTANTGNYPNRFILRYTNETLGGDDLIADEANLWVISSDALSVKSTKNTIQSVRVFDVLGRHLAYYPNVDGYEVSLNTIQKNNAGLVIQVTLSNGTVINKKAIY